MNQHKQCLDDLAESLLKEKSGHVTFGEMASFCFLSIFSNFMTFSSIFKTCSDQILEKLVIRVAAALFLSRRLQNFENEKKFVCLKIAEIDMGINFRSKRRFWT